MRAREISRPILTLATRTQDSQRNVCKCSILGLTGVQEIYRLNFRSEAVILQLEISCDCAQSMARA